MIKFLEFANAPGNICKLVSTQNSVPLVGEIDYRGKTADFIYKSSRLVKDPKVLGNGPFQLVSQKTPVI